MISLPIKEKRKREGGLRTKGILKNSSKSRPLISVITVVFNGEKYLEKTIKSVLNQTYDNVEYIIIDGGSFDRTLEIIEKYEDKIDYWLSESDKGIYHAMNKGVILSTGDYIIHINAGDYINKSCMKEIFSISNITKYSLIAGSVKFLSGKLFLPSFSKKLYLKNTLHHQGTFYSKNLFNMYGFYDLSYKILSDYNFNLKLYQNSPNFFQSNLNICICSEDGISDRADFINYLEEIRIRNKHLNNQLIIKIFLTLYSLIKFSIKRLLKILKVIKT